MGTAAAAATLPNAIPTVDEDIGTRRIGRSIRAEVHISTLQLLGLAITAHGNHALP